MCLLRLYQPHRRHTHLRQHIQSVTSRRHRLSRETGCRRVAVVGSRWVWARWRLRLVWVARHTAHCVSSHGTRDKCVSTRSLTMEYALLLAAGLVKESALPLGHSIPSFATRMQKAVGYAADAPRYLRDRAVEGLGGTVAAPRAAPAGPSPTRTNGTLRRTQAGRSPSSAVPPPVPNNISAKSTRNQPQTAPSQSYAPSAPQGPDAASAGNAPQLRRSAPASSSDGGGVGASAGENLSVGSLSAHGVNPHSPDVPAPGGADARVMGPSRWSRANTWARANPYQAGAIGVGAAGAAAGAGYVAYDQMRDRPWYEGFVR